MPYYIIFSKSAKEHQTVKSLKRIAKKNDIDIEFRLQEKEMVNHSRTGRVTRKYTLIPGYIFARSPESISPETLSILTGANDFFYFLTYSDKSYEMRGDDERYCSQLFDFPQVIRQKNVFIKAGEVVIVTRGAFTTLKGKILKIIEIGLIFIHSMISISISIIFQHQLKIVASIKVMSIITVIYNIFL